MLYSLVEKFFFISSFKAYLYLILGVINKRVTNNTLFVLFENQK